MLILDQFVTGAQTNDIVVQVTDMGPGYRWNDPDSVSRILANVPLTTPPCLRAFHLADETNLTDLVSQGYIVAIGLLASRRFENALHGFTVQPHERYDAEVVHHGQSYPYAWLHMIDEGVDHIDYSRSTFLIRAADGSERPITFADARELRTRCRELVNHLSGTLRVQRLTFLAGTPRYDLFSLRLTSAVFFVSDALAAELRRRKLTGFQLLTTAAEFTFS